MKPDTLLLAAFIAWVVLNLVLLIVGYVLLRRTSDDQATSATKDNDAKAKVVSGKKIKKKQPLTNAEQTLLLRRQAILRGCLYDPVEHTLKHNRHYMTPVTIYAKFCSTGWWNFTKEDVQVLIDGLVILRQVKRKKSSKGHCLYKWVA